MIDNNFFLQGSSSVNFCESDFFYKNIGEPFNVISSLAISLFGFYGLYKLSKINDNRLLTYKYLAKILYTILIFIGFGSMYFHLELSEFSHWVDIILISLILIFSNYCLELNYNNILIKIKYLIIFFIHLFSSLKTPSMHIFLQFITGFYIQNQIENKIIMLINTIPNNIYLQIMNDYYKIKYYFMLGLFFGFSIIFFVLN